jgi:hypothetical protein
VKTLIYGLKLCFYGEHGKDKRSSSSETRS